MVVGFTAIYAISPITSKVVTLNPAHCEVYSIQHYVIMFVSDLRQVSGFHRVLQFPPPIKLNHHDITEILLKVALSTITLTQISQSTVISNIYLLHTMTISYWSKDLDQ